MTRFANLDRIVGAGAAPAMATPNVNTKWMQRQLVAHGVATKSTVGAPGVVDEHTKTAVRKFQVAKRLPATGVVDAATHRALAAPPPSVPARTNRATLRAALQAGKNPNTTTVTTTEDAPMQSGQIRGKNGKSYSNSGMRCYIPFAALAVAAGATTSIPVLVQKDFHGENIVVGTTVGAAFDLNQVKVGTDPQIAGGDGAISMSIFSSTQTFSLDFSMDIANNGTTMTMQVTNTTTAAADFKGSIWGHVVEADS
jgi:peptidoglycan hydrolase-like protein with peptidoglycan-binding domain